MLYKNIIHILNNICFILHYKICNNIRNIYLFFFNKKNLYNIIFMDKFRSDNVYNIINKSLNTISSENKTFDASKQQKSCKKISNDEVKLSCESGKILK